MELNLEFNILLIEECYYRFENKYVDRKFKQSYLKQYIDYHKINTDPFVLFSHGLRNEYSTKRC